MKLFRALAAAAFTLLVLSSPCRAEDEDPRDEPPPVIYDEEIDSGYTEPGAFFMVAYLDKTSEGEKFRKSLPQNLIGDAERYLREHPEHRANPALLEALLTRAEKEALARGRRAAADGRTSPAPPRPGAPGPDPARETLPGEPPPATEAAPGAEPSSVGESSAAGEGSGDSPPEEVLSREAERLAGARSAAGGAGGIGGALAEGTRQVQSLPGGGASPGAPGGAGGDPSRPLAPKDLALAAGPYAPAFAAAGLKVENRPGGPVLLTSGGAPASPAQASALSAEIARMPTAAMRDPSYLNPGGGGISWGRFQYLKASYAARPELANKDFKHISLSEDRRDFKRSESCDRLSGDCNEHAEKSYKRGEAVPAKELDSIWTKINKYLTAAGAKDGGPPARRAARSTAGIWARISAVLGGGGGDAPAKAAARIPASREGSPPEPDARQEFSPAPADAPEAAAAHDAGAPEAPAVSRGAAGIFVALGAALLAIPIMRSKWVRGV